MRLRTIPTGLLLATAAPFVAPTQPPRVRAPIRLVSLRAIAFNQGPELPIRGSAARVDLAANRLIFPQHTVHLWVLHGPPACPMTAW